MHPTEGVAIPVKTNPAQIHTPLLYGMEDESYLFHDGGIGILIGTAIGMDDK